MSESKDYFGDSDEYIDEDRRDDWDDWMPNYLTCPPISKVGDHDIYISNYIAADDELKLISLGIKAVISLGSIDGPKYETHDGIHYLRIVIDDDPRAQLSSYFKLTNEFMKTLLPMTPILVHCYAGISRSVSVVISYLIQSQNMDFGSALMLIRKTRPIANPNDGFILQLEWLKRSLTITFEK